MQTFVALIDFTAQGVANVNESPKRADAFIEWAKSTGVVVKDLFWTTGGHDGVLVIESAGRNCGDVDIFEVGISWERANADDAGFQSRRIFIVFEQMTLDALLAAHS